jgi:hypothetical protein
MQELVRMFQECGFMAYVSLELASFGFLVAILALGVVLVRRQLVSRNAVAIVLAVIGVLFLGSAIFLGAVSVMGLVYLGAAAWVRRPSSSSGLALVIAANCFGVMIAISGMYGEMRGLQMTERAVAMVDSSNRELLRDAGRREAHGCTTLGYRFATPVEVIAVLALLALPSLGKKKES